MERRGSVGNEREGKGKRTGRRRREKIGMDMREGDRWHRRRYRESERREKPHVCERNGEEEKRNKDARMNGRRMHVFGRSQGREKKPLRLPTAPCSSKRHPPAVRARARFPPLHMRANDFDFSTDATPHCSKSMERCNRPCLGAKHRGLPRTERCHPLPSCSDAPRPRSTRDEQDMGEPSLCFCNVTRYRATPRIFTRGKG